MTQKAELSCSSSTTNTDKFIPFNPETAKNGDIVYIGSRNKKYRFIGNDVVRPNCVVVYAPDIGYGWENISSLTVKAPKKTVWVNVYGNTTTGLVYPTEQDAISQRLSGDYTGTYPLEIDDVA